MLKLKNISKNYKTGNFAQKALENINLEFNKNEFVSILGPSGSGKTTLLNIIGGLDRYTNGDLIINGKSTKNFKDKTWDYYRNNCIGFIFQNYNLISHINIIDNVELALKLSGIKTKNRRKKALEALKKVGLENHIHKKPNQLSGGQMQRVAIARAIVNNPDIILADEPTGALDSKTSTQIMNLIKEISKDKLVIMVTHNEELAKKYSTRVIELKDGNLINDNKTKFESQKENNNFKIKKTSMNFLIALKLSFKNIVTKKGRTLLTAFASSIGIIGIALILSLSNGFDKQIDIFEKETLSNMPIIISTTSMEIDSKTLNEVSNKKEEKYPNIDYVYNKEDIGDKLSHTNNITQEYINYLESVNKNIISGYSYNYLVNLNILTNNNGEYKMVDNSKFTSIPRETNESNYMLENYDLLYGSLATNNNQILLLVDSKNNISKKVMEVLGFANESKINYENIVGKKLKLIFNNELYQEKDGHFTINTNYEDMYNSENSKELIISGIVRAKSNNKLTNEFNGILYKNELLEEIIDINKNSQIVNKAREINYNPLTGEIYENDNSKNLVLSSLGDDKTPNIIYMYPKNFNSKEKLISYLDKYNKNKNDNEKIIYTDLAKTISSLSSNIMDAITIVLIAFSAISLIVSSIMIGIITYISVLERTKEIGILRSLGARKKDISRVFNAETFIIGTSSGLIGIGITSLLLIPANEILKNLTTLENVAVLNPVHAIILIIISIILTLIGGFIPAKIASKKDPVESLRSI